MMNKTRNIYDTCKELSKTGNKNSLANLFNIYMNSKSAVQKVAKQALAKSFNRPLVLKILEELISKTKKKKELYNLYYLALFIPFNRLNKSFEKSLFSII